MHSVSYEISLIGAGKTLSAIIALFFMNIGYFIICCQDQSLPTEEM